MNIDDPTLKQNAVYSRVVLELTVAYERGPDRALGKFRRVSVTSKIYPRVPKADAEPNKKCIPSFGVDYWCYNLSKSRRL